jgi:hypothetical protein
VAAPSFYLRILRGSGASDALGVSRKSIAVAAYQIDDQPDNSDEYEQRRQGHEQPEASGEDGAVAVDGAGGSKIEVAGSDGDVSADLCIVAYGQVPAEDGDVAGDAVSGVERDAAEEDSDITPDVAVDVDRAEGAGDVGCGVSFGHSDIVSKAGVVLGVGRLAQGWHGDQQQERRGRQR